MTTHIKTHKETNPAFITGFLIPIVFASSINGAQHSLYLSSLNNWVSWSYSSASFLAMLVSALAGFLIMMAVLEISSLDFPETEDEIHWNVHQA